MKVKDIVESDILSLDRDTTVLNATKRMLQTHHGFIMVTSSGGKAEGIVTEWDLVAKVLSLNRDPSRVKLDEIMSVDLLTIDSKEAIDSLAKLMTERDIRRVLVTEDGKIIGAVTAKTILRRLQDYIDHVSAQIARLQGPTF